MHLPLPHRLLAAWRNFARSSLVSILVLTGSIAAAQSPRPGEIEGRVQDASSGNYLEKARVSIVGTNQETLTDQYGHYSLAGVAAGVVTLRLSYTGMASQETAVTVAAGQTSVQDGSLAAVGAAPAMAGAVVELDPLVVAADKVRAGAALAINEQRYASNVKVVVATDEFGDITDGNVGEFLQYLPGVTADNNGSSEPKVISIYGLPPAASPILVNGFRLASASESNLSRQVYLADNSVNSMSRIEVNLSNTPDQPADAIGGSVNMITRNAFEYAKPALNFRIYGAYRDGQDLFGKSPGPKTGSSNKTAPGLDFVYVYPINDRLGVTINGSHNDEWGPQEYEGQNWSGVGANTAVPGETTTQLVSNPFMYRYNPMLGQGYTNRDAIGVTLDYKLADRDSISFAYIYGYFDLAFFNRAVTFNVGSVAGVSSYGPTFTDGAAGAGLISLTTGAGQSASFRHESGTTNQPMITWRHHGPVWTMDGGAAFSQNTNHYRDTADGFFQAIEVTMGKSSSIVNGAPNNGVQNPINGSPITINYSNINQNDATVQVFDANGNPIDPNNLNNYTIRSASSNPRDSVNIVRSVHVNAQRDFDWQSARLTLKAGADVREQSQDVTSLVDGQGAQTWTFVGADGVPGTADDSAGVLADPTFTSRHYPFGGPVFTYPSPFKLFQLFQAHPEYFVANTLNEYITDANNSASIRETVPAAYLQGELRLFGNRVQIVGGARYEDTIDQGQGLLRTNSTTPTTLAAAQSSYFARGLHVTSRYSGVYPSLNATLDITSDTLFRLAFGRTLFRPDFNNIIPGVTLPTGGTGTITLNNTQLAPWTADNYNAILEHYFENSAGVISIGVFQRNIKNFFATITQPLTPAFESQYDIDPAVYGADNVTTLENVSSAKIQGFHYEYKQALNFLPEWAHGLQFFTNGTIQRLTGPASIPSPAGTTGGSTQTNFQNFINKTFSTGFTFSRRSFTLQVNWLYRAVERGSIQATFTTTNGVVSAYNYTPAENSVNIGFDYRFTKNLGLFFDIRNATNYFANTDRTITGITPSYAQLYSQAEFNPLYILGIKGQF